MEIVLENVEESNGWRYQQSKFEIGEDEMKKIQAFVKYVVEVEFEISEDATEQEIKRKAEEKADEQWSNSAEVDDIDIYEI